uniref:peptidylprolyl isomerase n=1 Tax=Candidatus Kentrum sp. FM TaxID=2126340 RepID=A0A450TRN7_9GAMM|nr:MAG: peptidyl-prolyl cis-trans isomerase C [Candidatus Kentron sp. FM]VFJ70955.1 MAG: peptidyl-prolyl cis-trans isomerase C [Candidatus Kentron sp. FM]VFK14072.1 MAG: peptidyl-prolyl cis-trans isomerase C [Candidatus Kentron sp. FM]
MLKKKNVVALGKIAIVFAVAWGGGAIWEYGAAKADVMTDWHVLAIAGGQRITRADVMWELETRNRQAQGNIDIDRLSAGKLRSVVTDIAVRRKLLSEAQENTLLRKRIERGDLRRRIEAYRDGLIAKAQVESIAAEQVTDTDVANHYQTLKEEMKGKEEWHIRRILVEDKKTIKKARKELSKRPFEEVAKEFSIDKPSAGQGGDLGFVAADQLKEGFAKAMSKLSVGKTSKPFETDLGWHIAKIEEKRPMQAAPLDAVRARIRAKLESDAGQAYLKKIVEEMEIELRK